MVMLELFLEIWILRQEWEAGWEATFSGSGAQSAPVSPVGLAETASSWHPIQQDVLRFGEANRETESVMRAMSGRVSQQNDTEFVADEITVLENVARVAAPVVQVDGEDKRIVFSLLDAEKPWHSATDLAQVSQLGSGGWVIERVVNDSEGDFSPDIADLEQDVLTSVWVSTVGDLSSADGPEDIAPTLEIMVARQDKTSSVWGTPQRLTDNEVVDRDANVAILGGDSGLLWIQNSGSALLGTGTSGDKLMFSSWSGTDWSAAQTVWSEAKGLVNYIRRPTPTAPA